MSPGNLSTPYYDDGDEVTCYCSAAVTGKTFVKISGARQHSNPRDGVTDAITGGNVTVAPCGAADEPFGVAAYDAALGNLVTVYRGSMVVPVTAGAALTAGTKVSAGAAGVAVAASSGTVAGIAIDDAVSGGPAGVALRL